MIRAYVQLNGMDFIVLFYVSYNDGAYIKKNPNIDNGCNDNTWE